MNAASAGEETVAVLEPRSLLRDRGALRVARGEVHVWAFDLGTDAQAAGICAGLLCADELARAERFARPELRDRFVLAHGLQRHVLARYLDLPAGAIAFESGAAGKPALVGNARGLSFNLSDSHGRAVLAVSDGREVGIDLEQERPGVDILSIAGSYFFRSELEAIRGAPPALQRAEFFRYWVAKEAVLKGEGLGLGFPLDAFEIVFGADRRDARARSLDTERLQDDWTIRMLSLGPGWPVAVSARGTTWKVGAHA